MLIQSFSASTAAALVTAVNTFLAALVNPIIQDVQFSLVRQDGRIGDEYTITVRYLPGGPVLATPFLIRLDEAQSIGGAADLLQLFANTNPTYFFGPVLLDVVDGEQSFKKNSLLTLYNITAGASANYVTL